MQTNINQSIKTNNKNINNNNIGNNNINNSHNIKKIKTTINTSNSNSSYNNNLNNSIQKKIYQQNTEIEEQNVEEKINANNIDLNRIGISISNVKDENFVKVDKNIWNNGNLTYVSKGNGIYLIKNDGIPLGFTDQKGISTNNNNNNDIKTSKEYKIDTSRVAPSEYDVKNNNFVRVNEKIFNSDNLTIEKIKTNLYLIKNGNIPIGYTDEKGLIKIDESKPKEEIKPETQPKPEQKPETQPKPEPKPKPKTDSIQYIKTGQIKYDDLNEKRLATTELGVYKGGFAKDLLSEYKNKNLNYYVKDNGIVEIRHGNEIVGYTDIYGCDTIFNALKATKDDNSTFINYLIDSKGTINKNNTSLEKITEEYEEYHKEHVEELYSSQKWNAGNAGTWNNDSNIHTGSGIHGTFENGDKTFTSFCQGTGPWATQYLEEGIFYDNGCGVTALSTIFSGYIDGFTPSEFVNSNSCSDEKIKNHIKEYNFEYKDLKTNQEIIDELKKGHPVIYHISKGGSVGNRSYNSSGHFVTLLGYDEATGKVFLSDPGSTHNNGYYDLDSFTNLKTAYSVYKDEAVVTPIITKPTDNKEIDYTETNWVKSNDCGLYDQNTGTGILGTFTAGDNTYTSYCQGAGPWAFESLNGGKSFKEVGCAATAISSILSGFEPGFSPITYINHGGSSTKQTVSDYGYKTKDLKTTSEIIKELEAGHPVLYKIKQGGSVGNIKYKNNTHYVALLGINSDGKVFLSDPGSTKNDGYYDLDTFTGFESAYSVYS